MSLILKTSLVFLLLNTTYAASKFECLMNVKVRTVFLNNIKVNKIKMCINHPINEVMSYGCFTGNNCEAINQYKKVDKNRIKIIKHGNPFHLKCTFSGGIPTFIEYRHEKKWNKTAICLFDDNSFVSVFNSIDGSSEQ